MLNQYGCPCKNQQRVVHTNSFIRVLHASPDAPGVDIYVNNNPIVRNVTYKEFTQYIPLAGGLYNIKAYRAGTSANPLIDTNVNIPPRTIFTIVVNGMQADIALALVQEPPITKIPSQAYVRIAHFSPNAPHVDITLPNGTKLFTDIEYKEVSDYISVKPGRYELQARATGTDNIILTVPNINFKAGNIYTVYVVGLQNGRPPLQVLIPLDGSTYLVV